MKILITGMNKLQTHEDFFLRQQLKVVPSHYGLVRALRDMGHDVEQRVVTLGEDISHYDKVITFIHNPAGFSGFIHNGLYAISQRPDAIFAFDDWQIDSIFAGIQKLNEDRYRKYVVNQAKEDLDTIKKYDSDYTRAFEMIAAKQNKVLLSAYKGGDLSLLIDYPEDKLYRYLPVSYNLNRAGSIGLDMFMDPIKERRYNFSSLVQDKTKKWLKDINCGWPIDFYGSRKDKQERLTEDKMVDVYAKDWACLMPGYYNSGSGWWRARPQQVADSGSILIGDFDELYVYYNNVGLASLTPADIEMLNDKQLAEVAEAQRKALYETHDILNKDITKAELDAVLNG